MNNLDWMNEPSLPPVHDSESLICWTCKESTDDPSYAVMGKEYDVRAGNAMVNSDFVVLLCDACMMNLKGSIYEMGGMQSPYKGVNFDDSVTQHRIIEYYCNKLFRAEQM